MGFQKLTSPAISSLADGQKALDPILKRIAKPDLDWNEAQTRFSFLDDFLTDCLSWSKDDIHVEVAQGRSYTDYELGSPRQIIWEAKKEGKTFDLPANPTMSIIEDLASIIALGGEAAEAVKQAQQYCATRGVEFAVVSNGRQFIAFLAVRFDGTPPLEGKCFVINNVEQLSAEFPTVWQHLSPSGVAERRLFRLLTVGVDESLPPKLSSFLIQYPRIRYGSPIQTSLRTISELLLADIVETDAVEPQFYKECYCESGALSNNSLVSRQILVARYAAIFKDTATQPSVSPVAPRKGEIVLTPEVVAEAIARRPIVLVGDVGVGKTAFLKHLMYISAHDEFKKAIYIYIDLGSQGSLAINLKEFVLAEVEKQLSDLYQVDVYERRFIMGVYNLDIKNFDKGLYGPLKTKQPELYQEKILAFLDARITNKAEHLKRSIQHLARGRKKQVVLIIDNSDQRSYEIQQHAFLISQTLSRDWDATVFVAVRPATFYQSRQAGTLAAYTHRVLTISPPRADRVVEMRLKFALKLCEGEMPLEKLEGVRLISAVWQHF